MLGGRETLQYAIGMYVRGRETLQYAIGMYVRGEGDTAVCHRYVC